MQSVYEIWEEGNMKEDIIISIKGLRVTADTDEDVEVITPGKYYMKNNKHYLLFEEVEEESGASVKNIIKLSPQYVEVTKKGTINSKLCFEKKKSYQSIYSTMFGEFLMETKTDDVILKEDEDSIDATIKYELFINGESMSTNNIVINVKNKIK